MSKKLAIKGHPTRSKEVIELLEMMGGKDYVIFICSDPNKFYYVLDAYICWDYIGPEEINEYEIFTLEEFLEKYPFKVGDKVVYTKFGDDCNDYPIIIKSMKWTGTTIEYTFDGYVTCLAKDLKMWEGESNEVISGIYLNSCDYANEVELNLGNYEIEIRDNKTYAVLKKPKYPKTHGECCKILGIDTQFGKRYLPPNTISYDDIRLSNFQDLLICRNAYWKIAGKEMGIGKRWIPDWSTEDEIKYVIEVYRNNVRKNSIGYSNTILAFPTKEMRDAFYDNFKDWIEQCKDWIEECKD